MRETSWLSETNYWLRLYLVGAVDFCALAQQDLAHLQMAVHGSDVEASLAVLVAAGEQITSSAHQQTHHGDVTAEARQVEGVVTLKPNILGSCKYWDLDTNEEIAVLVKYQIKDSNITKFRRYRWT